MSLIDVADGSAFPHIDTIIRGASSNRSAIIGFTGAAITTNSGSTAITVTTGPTSGALQVGQIITATGIPAGTTLASGSGTSWTLRAAATASGTGVAMASAGPQQLMAANAARRGILLANQGTGSVYLNELGTATADQNSMLIPPGAYFPGFPNFVPTTAISVVGTVAATPIWAREP